MKRFYFFFIFLFSLWGYGQTVDNITKTKVVSWLGSFTTAERDLLDVPVNEVWMVYNSTSGILEFAREDDVWSAVGGGAADNLGADVSRGLFTVSGGGTLATLNLNTVDSTHIKPASIQSQDLADNTITSAKILNGTIVGEDIANNAIAGGKLQDGTILPVKLDAIDVGVAGEILALNASGQFEWVAPTAGQVAALADLSDVSDATQGNRFVLVSNGSTFSSRALVEADISDLAHTVNTDNQNARQVAVLDAGSRFDSINVEGVLEELYDKWVVGNDDQVLTWTPGTSTLSIENANSVDLSALLDNTDAQDLTLTGNTLAVTGDPNTDVDLSGYLDNTDAQDLTLTGNTLAVTGDPNTDVDLSGYLDNTDSQTLSFADPNLSITGGNSVDLTALKDGTGTDDQTAAEVPTTTTNFDNNLSAADTNVQLALETLDELVSGGTDDQVASEVPFTNTTSGLTATDVQAAIDEVEARVDANDAKVTNTDSQTLSFANPNLSITGGNSVDISAIDTNTQLSEEQVEDFVGGMVTTNTETLIDVTYQDVDGTLDFVVNSDLSLYNNATSNFSTGAHTTNTDSQTLSFANPNLSISGGNSVDISAIDTNTQRTDEEIEDVSGAMFTGNTETLITATYQDIDGTVDLVVNSDLSLYNNATSNFSTGAHTTNTDSQTLSFTSPNLSISGGNSVDISAIDTNTQLSEEQVEDFVGGMVTGNTETGITVTYQDADGTLDFVVDAVGDVFKVGIPVNNQFAIWTGDGTIEGLTNIYYTGTDIFMDDVLQSQTHLPTTDNVWDLGNGTTNTWGNVYARYGRFENGLYMTSTDTEPSPATKGAVYFDDSESTLKQYTGTVWEAVGASAGGVSDHGALTGLGDDDHPHYLRSDVFDTKTGYLTISGGGVNPLRLWGEGTGTVGDQSYVTGRNASGGNLWYVGTASTGNNDVVINNYDGGAYVRIKDGGEESGLQYYNGSSTRTVYHSGNLNLTNTETGYRFQTTGTSNLYNGQWTKIARVIITTQYSDANAAIAGTIRGHSQAPQYSSEYYMRVKQQAAFGNDPIIEIENYHIDGSVTDLGYVIVQNTPTTIVDFYIQINTTYAELYGFSVAESNSTAWTWYSTQAYSASVTGLIEGATRVIWHNANDGSSSGLNADEVDGIHGASFLRSDATDTASGVISFTNATNSTTKDNGAVVITAGGLGVEGEIHAGGDIEAFNTSDERLKQDIKPIKNAVKKVQALSGNTYKWKGFVEMLNGKKGKDVGVIAQEVEKVVPEAVRESSSGYLQVNYDKLVPLLIEAVKEQQEEIEMLKDEIKRLKK